MKYELTSIISSIFGEKSFIIPVNCFALYSCSTKIQWPCGSRERGIKPTKITTMISISLGTNR